MPEESPVSTPRFIADENVGKLARWLRAMGYDTLSFGGGDDSLMVAKALAENRVILTRDAGIMKRRLITSGRLKTILITSTDVGQQFRQVIETLNLRDQPRPFTICLECNQPLVPRDREQVKGLVPPYVFRTRRKYMQCPACQRVYWRGTHWAAMTRKFRKSINEGRSGEA